MKPFWTISAAGFAATAMTYGPGRMGFGLFLSDLRDTFGFSSTTAGFISGLGFFGFLLGLWAAYVLLTRQGPRVPVCAGLIAATAGLALVAAAPGISVLATGVFLAMSSAGFSWAPFNYAVHSCVDDRARPLALSLVSTGTSVGVALAGAAALSLHLTGLSWRFGWAGFAVAGAVATLINLRALRSVAARPGPAPDGSLPLLFTRSALPIHAVALTYGTVSAIYISFAADHVRQAGGLAGLDPQGAPAVLFISYGLFGLTGVLTGRLRSAIGLGALVRGLQVSAIASLVLIALAPTSWPALVVSAGLQGAHVMITSATLSFWTERFFPTTPSLSFTAALMAVAAGSALGPAAAGALSDAIGGGAMFLVVAGIPAATLVALTPVTLHERPQPA